MKIEITYSNYEGMSGMALTVDSPYGVTDADIIGLAQAILETPFAQQFVGETAERPAPWVSGIFVTDSRQVTLTPQE